MVDFRLTGIRAVPSDVMRETGVLAHFNVDLGVVLLVGCALIRQRAGGLRVTPPQSRDRRNCVMLAERTRARMLKAATKAYRGLGYELPGD